MKKLFFILPVLLLFFVLMTGQRTATNKVTDESPRWNLDPRTAFGLYPSGEYTELPQNDNFVPFTTETRSVSTPIGTFLLTPNFRVHPSAGTQSETPITRSSVNPLIMLASANTFRGGSTFSTGVYVTTDGGVSWYGSDTLNNGGFSYGDPGPMIDKDGKFLMSYITTAGSMGASSSSNNGINWIPTVTFPGASTSADKNLSGTDDAPTSPYYGRSYTVYTEFGGTYVNRIVLSYTTNSGTSWSTVAPVSPPTSSGHHHQGCDVDVSPTGDVYVVWANCTTNGQNSTEDSLGFAKSTNGGVNWVVAKNNANNMNGIRAANLFNGIRMAGFPRISVDKSGGARNRWIYVATSEKNVAPATDVSDAILHRSSDGGTTWSSVRVNQDTPGNGKYQYASAVRVDETGGVNVVYYDTRNTPTNDSAQVYVSRSIDGGATWTDVLVSDHKFKPKAISGLATGYQGDYIGITSGNSKAWPYWADDITGIYQAWTTSMQIATFPLNAFNLLTPTAGSRLVSFPNSGTPVTTITWDSSASTASYKWIFGNPTTSPRKITLSASGTSLTITAGQLDNILAGLGLAQGDSLVGQWDMWAFRNNATNDSLKATNGPRAITLKRGIPALTAFNLNSPPTGTTVQTTPTDASVIKPNWTRSGQGVKYKWIFASPTFTPANIKAIYQADNTGFDTTVSIRVSKLDSLAASLGVGVNDSISGQWRVYAYSAADSLASAQTYNLRLRRLPITTVTIGNGTADESYPLNRFYNYYRWQGIYLGSEIGTNGTIRKIKFYQNNSVGGVSNDNMRIFMTATTDSLLPTGAWDSTGMTLVFSGTTTSLSSPGWQEIQLTTPIYINSSQHLKIAICRDYLAYVSTYPRYAYSVQTSYRSRRGQSDTQYPTSLTQSFNRPNVQFEIGLVTGISNNFAESIPLTYSLSQNYPNPFNPTTKISFSIPKLGNVSLKIYDVLGKEVMTLINEQKPAGNYVVDFNGIDLASGAYFYRLESSEFVDIKRMILVK